MKLGELVANRFRIRGHAGTGGMGIVYRADDESSGQVVALKVLHSDQRPERFLREARVLADIHHPAVVRYVAHGVTADGRVYLAMEWIPGQPLSRLLDGRRLSYAECLALLRRLCSGLAIAHDKGVVHRDLKPANILLPLDAVGSAKLIDFGIARRQFDARLTEHGLLVGTLAYMSPEQARGASDVDASSDVFSLGSMVYKCLTGNTPFAGGDATAMLARILLEDPTPLGEIVGGIPEAFDELVARMLVKQRALRLPNARAVLEAVEDLDPGGGEPAERRRGIGRHEQRIVWLVLLAGMPPEEPETRETRWSTLDGDPEAKLASFVLRQGGQYDILADGTRVASFAGGGVPRDEALRAVGVAELMRELLPGRAVAVASGQGVLAGRAPMGEAIERGVGLIVRARPGEIRLDEATARLVRSCYELSDEDGPKLVRAMSTAEPTRNLLGRPTTCVGRDVELSMLEALLDECAQDSTARVAIVLGPAGAGKSRLRYELVRRASRRIPDLRVLFGRAQSVGAGSPFAPLRQALRLAAEIADGEDPETSRDKIERYIERSVSRAERRGALTVYLGELAGVPFPDGAHETLGAARQNPTLLGDAMRSAWLDFLTGLCETGPVILILEDMHWGDLPTASFVDAALSSLGDCPLFVLALARPEVFDVLPGLWETREPQLLRLGPLRRAAAVALAREVLGAGAAEGRIERVVELAEGNAFFLEELIRAVAEGRDELPESVLTMVQARLESLGSETRRVLRAGSVFGSSFRLAGVMALLGGELDEHYVAHELSELVQREWVSPRPAARGGGDLEYAFRHMVVQETVYATLTKDDRLLGHRLAAQWLEQTGSADASLLAEHYRRAELPERAARHYLRAAEQALEGADLAQTLAHVARALESNPDAQTRGALHYLAADAHFWRGEYQESERDARAAVELLPQGSPRWFVAIGALCSATGTLGKDRELMAWAARAAEVVPESDEARAAKVVCLVRASHGHLKHGLNAAADALIAKADEAAAGLGKLAALGSAWVHHGRSARAYYAGDMAAFVREVEASIAGFDEVGDWRTAGNARANLGYAALSMGDIERAERLLREALSTCERLGMAGIAHYVMHNLGLALALRGAFAEGIRLERQAIREAETRDEKLLIGATHLYMALILLLAGDAKGAEEEAKIAQAAAPNVPILLAQGLAAESAALLAQGRKSDGLAPARAAMALLEEHGGSDETEGRVRSAFVEALLAAELHDEAREAATFAVERLRERAARLGDPRLEQCFLEGVPEHARLIARAEQLAKPR